MPCAVKEKKGWEQLTLFLFCFYKSQDLAANSLPSFPAKAAVIEWTVAWTDTVP